MDYSASASEINARVLHLLDQPGGDKIAAGEQLPYIRDRLREGSFADQLMPPEKITRADCQISENHDTLVRLVEVEPDARATILTFRGQPDTQFMNGKRIAVGFYTIGTLRQEITTEELRAYSYPLTKVVEDIAIKEVFELKDREFITYNNTAIEAMQEEGNGSVIGYTASAVIAGDVLSVSKLKGVIALADGEDTFDVKPIQKADIVALKKLLLQVVLDDSGNKVRVGRLKPECALMTQTDAEDIALWTAEVVGMEIASETTKNGFTASSILSLRLIKSIKTDILTDGNVYVFAARSFYGVSYTLNEMQFWIEKKARRVSWEAWMDIGMAVINIAAVVKLELYGGSVTPGAETSGYAARVPVDIDKMGGVNNKVKEGLIAPAIVSY